MSKDFENNDLNGEPNSFGLPEDYFRNSAGSIQNKIEWLEEHKAYPRLSGVKKNCFVVPPAYFENSENRFELLDQPVLMKLQKQCGFTVPENYFEDQEVNALSQLLQDNENELAGFEKLSAIKKQNPFTVDENYFSRTEQKLNSLPGGSARVISLFSAKVWYSSAAAVLAVVIGLWLYSQYFKPVEKDCGTLACVDKAEIMKSKNIENLESEELYEIVDTEKLEENLNPGDEKNKGNTDSLTEIDPEDLPDEI